jgi:hypothetical protein
MNTPKSLIEIGIAYNQDKMQVMMAMQMNGKGLVDFVSSYPDHVAIVAFDYAIKSYPYGADTECTHYAHLQMMNTALNCQNSVANRSRILHGILF